RLAGGGRKRSQPIRNELAEAAWDRQLGSGARHLAAEGAEDLEREERVPARRPQEPGERRSGQADTETFPHEMVKRAERERRDLQPRDLLLRAKLLEPKRRLRPLAPRHEQADPLVLQASEHVGDDSRRGRVQPLDVVDPDQDGDRTCKRPNRSERRNGGLARLDGSVWAGLAAEERDL